MDIVKALSQMVEEDRQAQALLDRLQSGRATYSDACKYADRVGLLSSKLLRENSDLDPETIEEALETVIGPGLRKTQMIVGDYCAEVQQNQNAAARIGIRAKRVQPNEERIGNLMERLRTDGAEADFLLQPPALQNLAKSTVSDSIHENARFQKRAGLTVKISRTPVGGCCDWCDAMAGVYEYGAQPDDFFLAHRNCTCVWSTYTSKEVLSSMEFDTDDQGSLHRRVT